MMYKFGTDGIRSKADDFTPEFLGKLVKGLVDYGGEDIKVFLAGDTRESSEWIIADLEKALETFGIEYANAGVLPTPAINHCFFEMGFDFAIDITASHNPYTDNGIKIFERGRTHGKKLLEKGRKVIEKALASNSLIEFTSPSIREDIHEESVDLYKNHLRASLKSADFSGLSIGIDCANGATSVINKTIFEEYGATTKLINSDEKYNTNINQNCGSTNLEPLKQLVLDKHLDFGVAFDGDGDRCLAVDQDRNTVDGDEMLALFSNFFGLKKIVTTVMANQGLLNWAKENQIKTEITSVGDSNVVAAMVEKNIEIGSEQSGHVILPGQVTGDGILTALTIAKAVSETKKTLRDLAGIMTKYPQIIVNVEASTAQKKSFELGKADDLIKQYSKKLESASGRLLVRPSGTENLIRITMWGDDENVIINLANELANDLKNSLT